MFSYAVICNYKYHSVVLMQLNETDLTHCTGKVLYIGRHFQNRNVDVIFVLTSCVVILSSCPNVLIADIVWWLLLLLELCTGLGAYSNLTIAGKYLALNKMMEASCNNNDHQIDRSSTFDWTEKTFFINLHFRYENSFRRLLSLT